MSQALPLNARSLKPKSPDRRDVAKKADLPAAKASKGAAYHPTLKAIAAVDAVEGIKLGSAAKKRWQGYKARGLTAAEIRTEIRAHYRKARTKA